MRFKIDHNNLNVLNLEKSLAFYKEALGLNEVRRYTELSSLVRKQVL